MAFPRKPASNPMADAFMGRGAKTTAPMGMMNRAPAEDAGPPETDEAAQIADLTARVEALEQKFAALAGPEQSEPAAPAPGTGPIYGG